LSLGLTKWSIIQ